MSFALAVSIGNTRTQIGRIVDGVVQEFATVSSDTPTEALEQLAVTVEDSVRLQGSEISSANVGLAVLKQLRSVDEVAYLRFASVYKNFDAAADFHRELELMEKAEHVESAQV